jgi:hypothetical protein
MVRGESELDKSGEYHEKHKNRTVMSKNKTSRKEQEKESEG